jgi:hypothetical protein
MVPVAIQENLSGRTPKHLHAARGQTMLPNAAKRWFKSRSGICEPGNELSQEIHHGRFKLRRIVGPVAVDLPGTTRKGSVVRFCPFMYRIVSRVKLIVTAPVNGYGGLAGRSIRLVDFSGGNEASRDFDAEVHSHGVAAAGRMVIKKNVVPVRA